MPDEFASATPPNFLELPPSVEDVRTDAQRLRRARLEALGLSSDELFARVVDLEADLLTTQVVLSVALEQLQAAEAHRRHLAGRVKQLTAALRKPPESRR